MLIQKNVQSEVVVRLRGEVDHMQAQRLKPEIDELLKNPRVKRLVFEMDDVSFMDSSGIGVILGRYRVMKKRGGTVAVSGVGGHVDRIFKMAGLYKLVEKLG
ncbi:MAG: anti-sigma factor antagonist [Clostridia bacterium]|nr:anti-sigma factor antagonist [Clostridia bacterium]